MPLSCYDMTVDAFQFILPAISLTNSISEVQVCHSYHAIGAQRNKSLIRAYSRAHINSGIDP